MAQHLKKMILLTGASSFILNFQKVVEFLKNLFLYPETQQTWFPVKRRQKDIELRC